MPPPTRQNPPTGQLPSSAVPAEAEAKGAGEWQSGGGLGNAGSGHKVLAEQHRDHSWTLLPIGSDLLWSQTFLMQKAHAPGACPKPNPAPQHREAAMRTVLAVKKQVAILCWPKTQVALGQRASRLELADGSWLLSSSCPFSPTNCTGSILGSFLAIAAEISTVSSAQLEHLPRFCCFCLPAEEVNRKKQIPWDISLNVFTSPGIQDFL